MKHYSSYALALALFAVTPVAPAALAASASVSALQPTTQTWDFVGGDVGNMRYSALNQINTQNVKTLQGAWSSEKFADGAASRSTPVVKDGLMYVTAGSRLYAFDAKTGKTVWTYKAAVESSLNVQTTSGLIQALNEGNLAFPSPTGVAVVDGKLYMGTMDGHVLAFDAKNGKQLWSTNIGDTPPKRGQSVSGAPVYANGQIFVGLANGDWALRGRVVALDAKSGKINWTFFIVPEPGQPGSETWSKTNDVWKRGGGGVWQNGAVDAELGLVYFNTGNAVPQYAGEDRPGDNLYTCSIVALDMKTGKLRWHYQVVHHDLWEADSSVPPILYDAQVNGKTVKAVVSMRSDGYAFLLDRATGKPVHPVEERAVTQDKLNVTSPTQPFPVGGDSILPGIEDAFKNKIPPEFEIDNQFAPPIMEKQNVVAPFFGVRVGPMAYSPQTNYIYVQGTQSVSPRRRISTDPWYMGSASSGFSLLGITPVTVLTALDSKTNKIAWRKTVLNGPNGAGPLATAGGLVFQPNSDGNLNAYNAKTGEVLWQYQTGVRGGRGPASTYEIDGEQYVALAQGSSVISFKIGGTMTPPPPPPAAIAAGGFGGRIENTTMIETASLEQVAVITAGRRYALDPYGFTPLRARVPVGARVTFVNNSPHIVRSATAMDGSWSTGPINPGQEAYITLSKPGTYLYRDNLNPFSYGQIIVQAPLQVSVNGLYTPAQAARGKIVYNQSCSSCHGTDMMGRDQAPTLIGQLFALHWMGQKVSDLYDRISTTMPVTLPGSLTREQYLDVTAYLLQSNELPPAKEELKVGNTKLIKAADAK